MKYQEISPKFTSDFYHLVDISSNIVVTAHMSPDEDSISSVLTVFHLLHTKYPKKRVRILYSSDPDHKYSIFQDYAKIEFVKDIADHLIGTDLLIVLDGSNLARFSKKPEILKAVANIICIDHHSSPVDDLTLSLVTPQYPACAEVVFRSLYSEEKIDKPLAETFLLGILGDTGNFTYLKSHQTGTLAVAQKLLEISKIEIQEFLSRYQSISKRIFATVQEYIKNTKYLSVPGWPDFQYSYISREYKKTNRLNNNEVSEASHIYSTEYLRTIKGYTWGFVINPNTDGDVYVSSRSLPGSVNVRDFLERVIGGGGHDRASGGTFSSSGKPVSVKVIEKQILAWISSHKPVLV